MTEIKEEPVVAVKAEYTTKPQFQLVPSSPPKLIEKVEVLEAAIDPLEKDKQQDQETFQAPSSSEKEEVTSETG